MESVFWILQALWETVDSIFIYICLKILINCFIRLKRSLSVVLEWMFALVSTTVTTTTLTHVDNPPLLVATPLPPAPNLAPDHPAAMDPTCRSIPRMTEAVADPMFVARAVCVTELEECVQPLLGSDLVFHERLQRLVEIGIELPATHLQTELLYQPGRRYGIVKGGVRLFQKQSKLFFFKAW